MMSDLGDDWSFGAGQGGKAMAIHSDNQRDETHLHAGACERDGKEREKIPDCAR